MHYHRQRCQLPNPNAHAEYAKLLDRYRLVYPALKPLFHNKVRALRGIGQRLGYIL